MWYDAVSAFVLNFVQQDIIFESFFEFTERERETDDEIEIGRRRGFVTGEMTQEKDFRAHPTPADHPAGRPLTYRKWRRRRRVY